jgi:hypothetical protein
MGGAHRDVGRCFRRGTHFCLGSAAAAAIRTLVVGAGQQSSTGSGFLVGADGLAITNYHVVSQVALEPSTYRLEYAAADGTRGEVRLLAIDLPNDLAVVRLDKRDTPFFSFDEASMERSVPRGERLYSMGNPLDLGFTINKGTYNGLVERSYNERIHFTGALNPGMSGGPTVNAEGQVVGINVAKRLGGELVSFLVPARFAAALLRRVRDQELEPMQDFRAEIGRQLAAWQAGLYRSFGEDGFRSIALGPYQAPEATARWLDCGAQTNAGVMPKPRASIDSINCRSASGLFVANDLNTGLIQLSHIYLRAVDLNQFQFANFLTQQSQPRLIGGGAYRKRRVSLARSPVRSLFPRWCRHNLLRPNTNSILFGPNFQTIGSSGHWVGHVLMPRTTCSSCTGRRG